MVDHQTLFSECPPCWDLILVYVVPSSRIRLPMSLCFLVGPFSSFLCLLEMVARCVVAIVVHCVVLFCVSVWPSLFVCVPPD